MTETWYVLRHSANCRFFPLRFRGVDGPVNSIFAAQHFRSQETAEEYRKYGNPAWEIVPVTVSCQG